tara:strand:- start:24319 stop:24849 length:531 start_codon:yes stop_codon:yes gene_type:complete
MARPSVRVVLTVHFNIPGKLAIAAFLLFLAHSVGAEILTGRIVAIADGDTVTLLDANKQQHKIRLSGIDAPERKQAFGNVSRQHLARLVFGKEVIAECPKTDRYKRWICTIEVAGIDTNLAQVAAGMAWHYKAYQRDQRPEDRARYAVAEERAQEGKRGLWVDPNPQPPWEFRRNR